MKNKILLTTAIAFIGLFTFSSTVEAQRGRGGRGKHNHITHRNGNRIVVWHNSFGQCGNGWGYNNGWNNGYYRGNRMCIHMRNIYRGGRCGRSAVIRCNSRGCGMFGTSYRNGRFYNQRGYGNYRDGRGNGRYNQGGGRGNGGRYNQGSGRGNGQGNGGGRGRGNGRGR